MSVTPRTVPCTAVPIMANLCVHGPVQNEAPPTANIIQPDYSLTTRHICIQHNAKLKKKTHFLYFIMQVTRVFSKRSMYHLCQCYRQFYQDYDFTKDAIDINLLYLGKEVLTFEALLASETQLIPTKMAI